VQHEKKLIAQAAALNIRAFMLAGHRLIRSPDQRRWVGYPVRQGSQRNRIEAPPDDESDGDVAARVRQAMR
jgi:hypothetical protein